ncbi:MAG: 4Fe-4S binding protein [Desulfobacterales bacterium]|nr:4Fe-4S binding protein [Desulfobacterales bacterium]MBL7172147.1 4Fe-4S binding protein [Desulfobacteraceae bacterium]MBU0735741.1 4Fe-4S binding protein [Pseudomonadota bacterium]
MGKRYRTFEVYLVYIDPDKCDGCEECLNFCPVDVFDMAHKASVVRPQNCLGCRTCVAVCKSGAIIITEI